jgi:AcrR family transcriptional regulator
MGATSVMLHCPESGTDVTTKGNSQLRYEALRKTEDQRPRPRGRPRSVQAQEVVLAAAAQMLDEDGYGSLTIEGVAARSGVAKTTIYRSWPSKTALVSEVLRRRMILGSMPDTGDPRADLISFLSVNLRNYAAMDPAVLLPAFWDSVSDAAHRSEMRAHVIDHRRQMGRTLLGRLVKQGVLPPDTDADLLLDMWAGFAMYRFGMRETRVTAADVSALVDLVLSGAVPRRRKAQRSEAGVADDHPEPSTGGNI